MLNLYFLVLISVCIAAANINDVSGSSAPELYLNRLSQTTVQVYLHRIPYISYKEQSLDVSLWIKVKSSDLAREPEKWEYLQTIVNFIEEERIAPSFCSCYSNIRVDNALQAYNLRAVLRFSSNFTHLGISLPSHMSKLPSCMDEITFQHIETDDYYTITAWVSPSVSLMNGHVKYLTDSLMGFINNAEEGIKHLDNIPKGFSGQKFQLFLNSIGSLPETRYLEVGVFNGSSLTTILHGNTGLTAVAVDFWDPSDIIVTNMKNSLLTRIRDGFNQSGRVHIIHDSCWNVEPDRVRELLGGPVSVYFYDAGHTVSDHFLALAHYFSALEDVFVFLVDDWNWHMVRRGTLNALAMYPVEILLKIEVTTLTAVGKQGSWHNGMVAFILRKL